MCESVSTHIYIFTETGLEHSSETGMFYSSESSCRPRSGPGPPQARAGRLALALLAYSALHGPGLEGRCAGPQCASVSLRIVCFCGSRHCAPLLQLPEQGLGGLLKTHEGGRP